MNIHRSETGDSMCGTRSGGYLWHIQIQTFGANGVTRRGLSDTAFQSHIVQGRQLKFVIGILTLWGKTDIQKEPGRGLSRRKQLLPRPNDLSVSPRIHWESRELTPKSCP